MTSSRVCDLRGGTRSDSLSTRGILATVGRGQGTAVRTPAVPQLLRAALSKTTAIRWMAVASEGTRRRKGGWALSAQM